MPVFLKKITNLKGRKEGFESHEDWRTPEEVARPTSANDDHSHIEFQDDWLLSNEEKAEYTARLRGVLPRCRDNSEDSAQYLMDAILLTMITSPEAARSLQEIADDEECNDIHVLNGNSYDITFQRDGKNKRIVVSLSGELESGTL